MIDLKVNDKIYIRSYKHDRSIHRTWSKALVIEVNKDHVVVVTDYSFIQEANGRFWVTKEPAICFFYTNKWHNIISMVRKNGINYYINIASPALIKKDSIQYIDYDLDIKLAAEGYYNILDENEYNMHAKMYNYSDKLRKVLETELSLITKKIERKEDPFNKELIDYYITKYFRLLKNENKEV